MLVNNLGEFNEPVEKKKTICQICFAIHSLDRKCFFFFLNRAYFGIYWVTLSMAQNKLCINEVIISPKYH